MSFQTAGLIGGVAFLLSFLAGLVGGVPFFDIIVRALFWGALGFGGSLGVESLLRSLVPDLFVPVEAPSPSSESAPERMVDIVLDEERPGRAAAVIEEVEADDEALSEPVAAPAREPSGEPESQPVTAAPAAVVNAAEGDEEMPEIGSFLDAFKPNAPEGENEGEESAAPAPPEYGDYAPRSDSPASAAKEVTIDGETQDPQILAKAVQTVMKRDTQGS